jgi:cell wall-associated NlpC family hydrolase
VSVGRYTSAKRALAGLSATALASVTLMSGTGHAEPTIDQVEQRLDTLYHEAEAAQERLNTLTHELSRKRHRLGELRADLQRQRRLYRQLSDQVATMAAAEVQSPESRLTPTQRLLLSEDADDFMSDLAAQDALSDHKGTMLTEFSAAAEQLATRQRQVKAEVAEVAADQRQAAKEEATVDAKVEDAEDLLAELEAERRAALRAQQAREASRSTARPSLSAAPASGAAAAAVDFAMAQIGDAYVYGAAGPDAWDCSGLTMGAWAAAGVSLPHSSSAQMSSGTPVSMSELQPGDLVFYYSPVSHVGIYVGNGQIVHASNPESPVGTAPVDSMPFSGAVRPG